MITFDNVSKTFKVGNRKVEAVKNVSFTVKEGDIFGIIGFSGAGKSTLIRLVNALEKPTEGMISVNGTPLHTLKPKQLREVRRNIGMVFQNFNLFSSRTVEQNVAYPLKLAKMPKKERDQKVKELLQFVGLADKAKNYPEQLSGGQKQRVGIARALATDPELLLCDEATSALDPNTTRDILNLLKKVNRELGITILLITHEMQVIQSICNRVAVMELGEVIEKGEVFDTFTNPQHSTTKEFIFATEQVLPSEHLLDEWRAKGGKTLYRVIFKGESASDPVLSQVTREYGIDFNIIYGSIRELQQKFFGNLVVSFEGDEQAVQQVIAKLDEIVDIEEVVLHES
ncbi:MAG TPA: methionine ABC transporter ATP-binding protein [Sporosarcina sp.]|nr:methionine ABC transporter ATP-binding protein [Sporosarcina sp.]